MNSLSTQQGGIRPGITGVKVRSRLSWLALAAVLAGCAAIGPQSPEQVVKERAQARWDALLKSDFHAAYEYLSPGSRSVQSEASYVGELRKGFWKSAKVDKVECRNDKACSADVTIEYEFQGQRTRTPLRESWVREGSQWWYVKR